MAKSWVFKFSENLPVTAFLSEINNGLPYLETTLAMTHLDLNCPSLIRSKTICVDLTPTEMRRGDNAFLSHNTGCGKHLKIAFRVLVR